MHVGQKNNNPVARKIDEDHHAAVKRTWLEDHQRNHAEPRAWCPHCREECHEQQQRD